MGKTGVIGTYFNRDQTSEARLWKDDDTGVLSLSIDDPWDGFTPKQIRKLHQFLTLCLSELPPLRKRKKRPKRFKQPQGKEKEDGHAL